MRPEDAATPSDPVARLVVEVAPYHLDRPFDYTVPDGLDHPVRPGSRVEVVFAGRRRRALVVDTGVATDVAVTRLRPIRRVFGPHAWVTADELAVLRWAAHRFAAPLADVVRHALPGRVVAVERDATERGWFPPDPVGARPDPTGRTHAGTDAPSTAAAWRRYDPAGGRLERAAATGHGSFLWRPRPDEDVAAAVADLAAATLAGDRGVLVVTPDGASRVARDLVARLQAGVGRDAIVDVRGGTGARATYRAWLRARCGRARVVVGERGVAFWPVPALGLAVVLDEANPAHKERRSPRHHVREVLLERARRARGTGLLVTTVPAAPTWRLLQDRRLDPVVAPRGAEREAAPHVRLDDGSRGPRTRLGTAALPVLRDAVASGRYGVVLAARRGQGAALVCRACASLHRCPTCRSSVAAAERGWACGVCGWTGRARACPACGGRGVVPLAAGAEQVAAELGRSLDAPVVVLEGHDRPAPPPPAVLVMTRGSVMDRPPGPVGAVVIGDLDRLARRPAVDAPEDTLRLCMALASWVAGTDAPVVVRTDAPSDPVVQALVRWDPGGFWRGEGERRAALGFPPVRHAIAVDAPDDPEAAVMAALVDAFGIQRALGPLPADHGRLRAMLLVDDRDEAVATLHELREQWSRDGRDVRIDVDPVTLG